MVVDHGDQPHEITLSVVENAAAAALSAQSFGAAIFYIFMLNFIMATFHACSTLA